MTGGDDPSGPSYDDQDFGETTSTGSSSGYDADEAWTVRKESPGPGWTVQAGAGSGPGWGSIPTYESDATPSGTGYGETARYEAEAVQAAESEPAPADPDAEPSPDYTDPIGELLPEDPDEG